MNVRLIKTWHWQSGLVYRDAFYINTYTATVHMHTTSMYDSDHDIAYGRMDYWFEEVMQDSVMIAADASAVKAYAATGQRTLLFPDDPVDQLVGIMLCLKLNAITEGRLIITDVDISSVHGADMTYQHNQAEAVGPLGAAGWWQDARPIWNHTSSSTRGSKIVSLNRAADWHSLHLDWQSAQKQGKDSSIVFADFDRDEDR
jgi:hypothetical protein